MKNIESNKGDAVNWLSSTKIYVKTVDSVNLDGGEQNLNVSY